MAVLTPARLISVDHRTGADLSQDLGHCGLGLLGGLVNGAHDGSHAEAQPVHGAQIPLDGADGQSGLLPERGNQADQVDPQTLLSQHHPVQLCRRYAATPAPGAGARDIDVLGNFRRYLRQVNDLPSALDPAAG